MDFGDPSDFPLMLQEKFVFLHIKPYNKNIYNHIQNSTAFIWRTAQSQELELVADVTAD